ncbi:MAG: 50S ribosomal protein L28 [Deltaproteobacteria bacterium]|nr:50S ribosomal protein L28 [Deltaproteobacteria bacterium]
MSRKCFYCEKKPLKGQNVSHANNKTKKWSLPNLHSVRALIDGSVRRIRTCAKCLKKGFVVKAA